MILRSNDLTKLLPATPARKDLTQALEISIVRFDIPRRWFEGVIGRDVVTELPAEWTPDTWGKSLRREEGLGIHAISPDFFSC